MFVKELNRESYDTFEASNVIEVLKMMQDFLNFQDQQVYITTTKKIL